MGIILNVLRMIMRAYLALGILDAIIVGVILVSIAVPYILIKRRKNKDV